MLCNLPQHGPYACTLHHEMQLMSDMIHTFVDNVCGESLLTICHGAVPETIWLGAENNHRYAVNVNHNPTTQ